MKNRPVYLFAFANDKSESLRLKEEERIIRSFFDPLHDAQRIEVHYLSDCTVDDVYQQVNRFHNRLSLFHFSGHSGAHFLELVDKKARASFLSFLLGNQKQLELVVLNGCSNDAQVKELQQRGVKNIIATAADIEDKSALFFSKSFYQALISNQSLGSAFEATKAIMLNEHPAIQIATRSIIKREKTESDAFEWGLYTEQNQEDLLYVIPAPIEILDDLSFSDPVMLNYKDVNKKLVELTFKGMSEYGPDYKALWSLYQQNTGPQLFNTLQNMMLDSFPTSLGVQLRDLFTPEGESKGRLRLREMNETYLTLIKLVATISIANLWDTILDKETFEPKAKFRIRPAYKKDIKKYIDLTPEEADRFDYIWLVATINRIFEDNDLTPFITELNSLHASLRDFDIVYDAYRFLETELRTRIIENNIDVEEVKDLCLKCEHHLGVLLRRCAFLCTYQIVTIKDISLEKPRHTKLPVYVHNKAVMKGRDYATIDNKPLKRDVFTSNNSVIVTKDIRTSTEQLNLSPFVIDQNAFKVEEDKLPKIHYFKGWLNKGEITYEHAEMLEEDFEVRESYKGTKYKDLEILLGQFQQFRLDFNMGSSNF